MIEWARSTDATDFMNWWAKELAAAGVAVYGHHTAHSTFEPGGTWGVMEHQGDTDAAKYLGIKEFYDNGGVPKP